MATLKIDDDAVNAMSQGKPFGTQRLVASVFGSGLGIASTS